MSFGYATKRNTRLAKLSPGSSAATTPWIRNPSWTALPSVTSGDNKFVGLHGVDRDSNFLALRAAGNYTVDWGDGSATENINTGVDAQHQYTFTDAGLDGTDAPVTLTDTGDLVSRTSHGYSNGYTVRFYNIVSTTGLSEAQVYYVISATTDTFQVSATQGGSAVTLTTDGTATLLPYKLAVVTVTPQAGQTFTTINLHRKHTQSSLNFYSSGFLDIVIAGSSLTSILIGVTSAGSGTQAISFSLLEQVSILSSAITSASYLFYQCRNLANVVAFSCSTVSAVSMTFMFSGCSSLTSVPLFNTASVTDMSNMFINCTSLTTVPLFNTASVTTMGSMFNGCRSLTTVPLFNTVAVTTMSSMFSNCFSLTSVPLFNTVAVINGMGSMFSGCYSLATVPLFNTASVTNMSSMFSSCWSLTTVPLFNTVAVTNMGGMFTDCRSLTTVPLFNTAAVINGMAGMFGTCHSLTSVPLFNTASVTDMSGMFTDCRSLTTVPLFNTAAVTNMINMFSNCFSLTSVPLFNTAIVTSMSGMFSNCTSLTTVPLFNTVAVTNSMVSMFSGCNALTSVPLFNTASVTSMSGMFSNCWSLTTVPLFNTAAVTNMSSMFNMSTTINSLTSVPLLNAAAATNLLTMFSNCNSLSKATLSGPRYALSYPSTKLSETEITSIMDNLGTSNTQALTFSIIFNWGAVTPVSLTCTPTAGSTTITAASTTGVTVGMQWTGVGSPATTAIACTFTDAGDLVTKTAHGLSNGDEVSFATIVTTTGISINKIYFVVGATANTFQVALTSGGAAVALTTNGTGTVRWRSVVTAVTPNTSIMVSRPATATGSTALAFRTLKTQTALLKGWAVSG